MTYSQVQPTDFLTSLRLAVLREHLRPGQRTLEIGAFTRPTLTRPAFEAHFVDFFSTEELREQCSRNGDDPANVINVDYVVKGEDYRDSVKGSFDVVVANHVLEHISNPIQWLNMLGDLTVEGGLLFLSLPDKRHSFDILRDETSLAHILSDYLIEGRDLVTEHCIESEIYYDRTYIDRRRSLTTSLSLETIKRNASNHHPGIHCHVFNEDNFINKIMAPIIYMNMVPWSIVTHAQEHRAGEFYTILRKGIASSNLTDEEFFSCLERGQ